MAFLIAKHISNELIKETVKTLNDEDKLLEIAKDDGYLFAIRDIATKQITNNDLLKEIIFDTSDTEYVKDDIIDIRETAVAQITDDETLLEIVKSYYDNNIDTKYGLNVVKLAVNQINEDNMLIDISESGYDEEIVNLAVANMNKKFEVLDKSKLRTACDDDSKVKRMIAIDKLDDDDELLLDVAMNARYLDVRQIALDKMRLDDEQIIALRDIIREEEKYQDARNDYVTLNEDNEEIRQDVADKASNLGVKYKRIGNPKKEKFYNQQCKLFKNN